MIQFMQNLYIDHWNVVIHILRYLKKAPRKDYIMKIKEIPKSLDIVMLNELVLLWTNALPLDIVFSMEEIVSLERARYKNVVSWSIVEAKCKAMASLTFELIWIKQFPQKLDFCEIQSVKMCCDNQTALYNAFNLAFHERSKHMRLTGTLFGISCCLKKFVLRLADPMMTLQMC